eukprot:gnl/MRDRNA2_/MRDRNA2_175526_c0_seq1.p1 gnl/MRDRNA2_/MRDRNA2_175526_c0~~gnl/MRDRNA2_/MRDRNA2_175526_c0_seq1.p1  ORF type:complete len:234 (-),score=27.58 gnl/MRDRNA2_/MRDRNA2_175526_c0_seq1:149-850(-)
MMYASAAAVGCVSAVMVEKLVESLGMLVKARSPTSTIDQEVGSYNETRKARKSSVTWRSPLVDLGGEAANDMNVNSASKPRNPILDAETHTRCETRCTFDELANCQALASRCALSMPRNVNAPNGDAGPGKIANHAVTNSVLSVQFHPYGRGKDNATTSRSSSSTAKFAAPDQIACTTSVYQPNCGYQDDASIVKTQSSVASKNTTAEAMAMHITFMNDACVSAGFGFGAAGF